MTKLTWRFIARIIDNSIFGIIGLILFFCGSMNILVHWNFYIYVCLFLYNVILHSIYGQTLGKKCFDIKLVDMDERPLGLRQIILRELFVFIILYLFQINLIMQSFNSPIFLKPQLFTFISYGMVLIDLSPLIFLKEKKRFLHDILFKTKVINIEKKQPSMV